MNKTPVDVGFPAEFNWTAALAAAYIKKNYGYEYSIKGVTLIFKRLNLTFTRPTYTLPKADPEKQKQFHKAFKTVKKIGGRENPTYPVCRRIYDSRLPSD